MNHHLHVGLLLRASTEVNPHVINSKREWTKQEHLGIILLFIKSFYTVWGIF